MISYRPLKRLLVNKGYTMRRLCIETGMGSNIAWRLAKNMNVNLNVVDKICAFFKCQPSDVVVYLEDDDADI